MKLRRFCLTLALATLAALPSVTPTALAADTAALQPRPG
jgi:hypothetical protein